MLGGSMMIVLVCPDCLSTHIKRYEGKMTENGHSWFTCVKCSKNFPLARADYREESNIY